MWIATRKQGIFLYNTQTKKLVQYEVPCNDNNVVYILNDSQNNIWISGLHHLCLLNKANNTFETFTIKNEKEIYSMALWEDNNRHIWIGTWEDGLWKLNTQTKEVEKYLISKRGKVSCTFIPLSNMLLIYYLSDRMTDLRCSIQSHMKDFSTINMGKIVKIYPISLFILY